LPGEDPADLPSRVAFYDACKHHTCAVIEEELQSNVLKTFLWHLRRGQGFVDTVVV